MSNREQIFDVLKKAYQIEVDGYTFYSMTAERAEKEAVRELFAKLAADEVQHQAFLRNVAGRFDEQGVDAFKLNQRSPEARSINQAFFSGRFREQAASTEFELGVLSVGMTLETNAVRYFSTAAEQATEKEVKEFYQFLADWEKQHYDALHGLFNAVRAEHQAESSFSPF
ncbi:MAG: ferritin family protein [Thermoanaerobaculaceae bacterium]|jgi:rubrerythrin